MEEPFDPYYTWLGIPPDEQPADYYRLLGVRRFEPKEEVILNAADQRMAHLRTYQTGRRSKESQRLLNEVAAAQGCLIDPAKKRAYDQQLQQKLAKAAQAPCWSFIKVLPTPNLSAACRILKSLKRCFSRRSNLMMIRSPHSMAFRPLRASLSEAAG